MAVLSEGTSWGEGLLSGPRPASCPEWNHSGPRSCAAVVLTPVGRKARLSSLAGAGVSRESTQEPSVPTSPEHKSPTDFQNSFIVLGVLFRCCHAFRSYFLVTVEEGEDPGPPHRVPLGTSHTFPDAKVRFYRGTGHRGIRRAAGESMGQGQSRHPVSASKPALSLGSSGPSDRGPRPPGPVEVSLSLPS